MTYDVQDAVETAVADLDTLDAISAHLGVGIAAADRYLGLADPNSTEPVPAADVIVVQLRALTGAMTGAVKMVRDFIAEDLRLTMANESDDA